MQIETAAADVVAVRKVIMEFILAEHGECGHPECRIEELAASLGVSRTRFPFRAPARRLPVSSDFVTIVPERCVHCDRCIEACAKDRNVLARSGHGTAVHVSFDDHAVHGAACSVCGDCVSVCPAGGLLEAAPWGTAAE